MSLHIFIQHKAFIRAGLDLRLHRAFLSIRVCECTRPFSGLERGSYLRRVSKRMIVACFGIKTVREIRGMLSTSGRSRARMIVIASKTRLTCGEPCILTLTLVQCTLPCHIDYRSTTCGVWQFANATLPHQHIAPLSSLHARVSGVGVYM